MKSKVQDQYPRSIKPVKIGYIHKKWHDHLFDQLNSNTNPRTIVWYYDKKGNSGKTRVATYLMSAFPDKVLVINRWSSGSDFISQIADEMSYGWTGEILIIDIARSRLVKEDIYEALDSVMGGCVNTTGDNGRCIVLPTTPKVFVFSNVLPDITSYSADKWDDVYEIVDKDSEPKKMTIRDIVRKRKRDIEDDEYV